MKPSFQAIKFSHAFASSCFVLVLGLLAMPFIEPSFPFFGGLIWWALPLGAFLGILFYAFAFVLTKRFFVRFTSIKSLMDMLHQSFFHFSWLQIAIISAMAGLGEELLLRGVVQSALIAKLNPVLGILIASLLFGLLHFQSKTYVFMAFSYGLIFGVLYHLTDSLLLVMVIHAVYNFCAFTVLVKAPEILGVERVNANSDFRAAL